LTEKTEALTDEQVTDIVKKKKRGSNWMRELSADNDTIMKPGENARYIRYAMASLDLPPIDISDPDQVAARIRLYFQYCADNDRRPQIVGLCNWLGISRDTLNTWKNEEYRSATHSDIIKKAYGVLEEMWVDYMQNGKISPPTAIFLAKNFFNYKDVADVVVTPNNPLQDLNDDQAKKRIMEAIPESTSD
jgi:hypothetical protein